MGNQQSLPDGSTAPPLQYSNSPSPIRSHQTSNAAKPRNFVGNPPISTSGSTVDPALLAEYQRLRKEILDETDFSNDALLPLEIESSADSSQLNLSTSTPWTQSEVNNKQRGYRVQDTFEYYDDSGTTFNDIADARKFPAPGPPSPPLSASYATRPKQAAAVGTGMGGYQATGEGPARSRAPTDTRVGRGGGGLSRDVDKGNVRSSVSPPLLPPGMPVRVNQNGDAVVDLLLEDGTPLHLRHAKRQFDRDKFKRANQQATGDATSPVAPAAPSLPHPISVDHTIHDGPDPHTIPLPNSPIKPVPVASSGPIPPTVPLTARLPTANQPPQPSTNGLSDTDEALMDEILRLV